MPVDDSCPVCRTADIVCGKWTLLLVRELAEGRSRFCELERSLTGISPRTLSLRLRALEEEGIVERSTYAGRAAARRVRADGEGPRADPDHRGHARLRRAVAGRDVRERAAHRGGGRDGCRRRRLSRFPRRAGRLSATPRSVTGSVQRCAAHEDRAGVSRPDAGATPTEVGRRTFTRRRALALGAAAGVGSLVAPLRGVPALAASARGSRPRGFGLTVTPADFDGGRTSRVLRARGASTCSACAARAARGGARAGARAARGARGSRSPRTATTRPTRAPAERASDPVWTGGSDELQLRLRAGAAGVAARALRRGARGGARRARAGLRAAGARRAGGRRQPGSPPPIVPRAAWGGRRGAAALGAALRRRAGGVRAPHGHRERVRAAGLAGDRARHREVPPRHERLERHRLQLPRRQVRPGLRGPRRRGRPGRDRRARAGLQRRVDERRAARDVHRRRDHAAGARGDRAAARLEALAARGAGDRDRRAELGRRQPEPLPGGDAGDGQPHLRPSRRRRDLVPRRRAVRAAAGAARAGGGARQARSRRRRGR